MHIDLPVKVKKIIRSLEEGGFEAYAVGGCVRDTILGRTPGDWDITTSAPPGGIKAIFPRTVDTGIEHGTVTVLIGREGFEVTTYRIDGKYADNRHPSTVMFTRSLKEDLRRRDFTMNAMAYNETDGLKDFFGGMKDLKDGIIRCVGDPGERFLEDALRIMRAVRFAAQLGFDIEDKTRQGIKELAPLLRNISAERISSELIKIVTSENPGMLREAFSLGITGIILPEFDEMMRTGQETPHHMYTVGEHTIKAMENIRADRIPRLTMLLHDIAKPKVKTMDEDGRAHFKMHDAEGSVMAREILRRLKFDNYTTDTVVRLVRYHDYRMPPTPRAVRRAISRIGENLFPLYIEVRMADVLAQSGYMREEKLRDIDEVKKCYREIIKKGECVSLKTLAVTGRDLIGAGMEPGRAIGETLSSLLDMVIEHPEYNDKETLLGMAEDMHPLPALPKRSGPE